MAERVITVDQALRALFRPAYRRGMLMVGRAWFFLSLIGLSLFLPLVAAREAHAAGARSAQMYRACPGTSYIRFGAELRVSGLSCARGRKLANAYENKRFGVWRTYKRVRHLNGFKCVSVNAHLPGDPTVHYRVTCEHGVRRVQWIEGP